ncbi:MAG: DNA repair protein RecO [Minisyncoccota bacterium]
MSYQIYTTEAIIIKRLPYDSNVSYLLYTKDFGLISAMATGVRKSESKLRYALQEYSLCEVSIVKGRYTWRITSALLNKNLYTHSNVPSAREVIARVCTQIVRLVAGQEKDEQLFQCISTGLHELSEADFSMVQALEILIMLRMLFILGYVSDVDMSVCTPYNNYNMQMLDSVTKNHQNFIGHINKGLQESQL